MGGILASTLTKLVLRLRALGSPAAAVNAAAAEAMLIIVAVMRLGASSSTALPLDDDSRDRMATCLRVLAQPPDQETMQVRRRARSADSYPGPVRGTDPTSNHHEPAIIAVAW